MMALTHGIASVALAAIVVPVVGDVGPAVLVAAFVGGVVPDLDAVATHRRTLHYPVGYALLAGGLGVAALTGNALASLAAVGATGATLHSLSDIFAGGAELEPWNPASERAVYNHVLGAWHRPRRYVRYSGAPEDFLLTLVFAAVAVAAPATGPIAEATLWALAAVAGGYTLVRKRIGHVGRARALLPRWLDERLPSVVVSESESGGTTLGLSFRSGR